MPLRLLLLSPLIDVAQNHVNRECPQKGKGGAYSQVSEVSSPNSVEIVPMTPLREISLMNIPRKTELTERTSQVRLNDKKDLQSHHLSSQERIASHPILATKILGDIPGQISIAKQAIPKVNESNLVRTNHKGMSKRKKEEKKEKKKKRKKEKKKKFHTQAGTIQLHSLPQRIQKGTSR